ncbi:transposable element Tcb2 transposase [Trichonephila clavipes]|nr:transposable element Tcb2 transposase [Trichonephila clavipes]
MGEKGFLESRSPTFRIDSSRKDMRITGFECPDWRQKAETCSIGRRPGQGRRRATMPNEDRYLVLTARRHRNMNATLLQQHIRSATGPTVSTQTVRNRLYGVGLYARRLMAPHRANLVEDFLFEEGIVRMEWPTCSPDMNVIEHVWDALGKRGCWLPTTPTNSPRTGKSSSGRVGQNSPTRD